MSNRIFSQQSIRAQRVARAINNPNEPTACHTCGSIYFMEMTAQMYTTGGYGLRAVSTTPMKVYMCPCGEILTPAGLNSGNQAGGERDLFAQSLARALAYRAERSVDTVGTLADNRLVQAGKTGFDCLVEPLLRRTKTATRIGTTP